MPSLDHLATNHEFLEGRVVSVTPARNGVNVIVCDDTGVDLGNRKRWIGYLPNEAAPEIRTGSRVKFLPGNARKGKMGRAYEVEILQDEAALNG